MSKGVILKRLLHFLANHFRVLPHIVTVMPVLPHLLIYIKLTGIQIRVEKSNLRKPKGCSAFYSLYAMYASLMPPLSAMFSPWVCFPFRFSPVCLLK